jgi:hypothetical protein
MVNAEIVLDEAIKCVLHAWDERRELVVDLRRRREVVWVQSRALATNS